MREARRCVRWSDEAQLSENAIAPDVEFSLFDEFGSIEITKLSDFENKNGVMYYYTPW